MTAQPQRPMTPDEGRSGGLKSVTHVIAVSSCKGGLHHYDPSPAGDLALIINGVNFWIIAPGIPVQSLHLDSEVRLLCCRCW